MSTSSWFCKLSPGIAERLAGCPIKLTLTNAALGDKVGRKKASATFTCTVQVRMSIDILTLAFTTQVLMLNIRWKFWDHNSEVHLAGILASCSNELGTENGEVGPSSRSENSVPSKNGRNRSSAPDLKARIKALVRRMDVGRAWALVAVTDTVIGSGPVVQHGDQVTLRYIVHVQAIDGVICEQNTKGKKVIQLSPLVLIQPLTCRKAVFRVGDPTVIKGFSQGLLGMCVGGCRVIYVPSHLGYGRSKSRPIKAPKNCDLYIGKSRSPSSMLMIILTVSRIAFLECQLFP
ncbi:hypothetical protein BJ165DRAFT_1410364 [Panaeolus papilionaceus]|nr:hypothetical protein BJ165DRAFT_1410364 [Panaeolus papilionaceus]